MTEQAVEINFDGLVGPTHNYGGLSFGNIASMTHKTSAASPRQAALEGLEKMKFLMDLGFSQAVLPPHERPYLPLLRQLGYTGTDTAIWEEAARQQPLLLLACTSAAAMWTANAATLSPSSDSLDQRVHITPANLSAKLHRSLEATTTSAILQKIFAAPRHFAHHPPLPQGAFFSDEGAANHTRLCKRHALPGIQLFAWGKSVFDEQPPKPRRFPPRQALEASQAIARKHLLHPDRTVYAQQHPDAIDAGVFHNDVIAIGNENVFLFHSQAFVHQEYVIKELRDKFSQVADKELILLSVDPQLVSLQTAVATYLFNSQILTASDGSMVMLAPKECEENVETHAFLQGLISSPDNPIQQVHYCSLRESMHNGGGPACLRLRAVLTAQERQAMHQGALLTPRLYEALKAWIVKHYRDRLCVADLSDPQFLLETQAALHELTKILQLGTVYEFQK